jgi:hypothetical protein
MDKLFKFFGKKKPENKSSDARNLENMMPSIIQEQSTQLNEKVLENKTMDQNSTLHSHQDANTDIVIVNPTIQETKNEGFYYKKYIDRIQKLQISNPILMEREQMKVNFDYEVMDYLVNDMTMIFREKQNLVDENLVSRFYNII